jgi:chemotaxis-related protein WspB
MLLLLFQLGNDRYALQASTVAEVLPLVNFKRIPQAQPALAGLIDYRGAPVPVIDLNELMSGKPAAQRFSTRVVLVHYRVHERTHLLGLIAERVRETVQRDPALFVDGGVNAPRTPWLGPVATDADGMLQWIHVDKLLPQPLRDLLFQASAA